MRLSADVERAIVAMFTDAAGDRVRTALEAMPGCVREPERVCWCVLFLGEGDAEKTLRHAAMAATDYRDVIWWAEYDGGDTRLRDLSRGLPDDRGRRR